MSFIMDVRAKAKESIEANEVANRSVHLYVTSILLINIIVILFVMIAIPVRLIFSGLDLIDSLPIAIYLGPFLVILPLLVRAFYKERTGLFNLLVVIVTSVFLALTAPLVHGFFIILLGNIAGAILLLLVGKFRLEGGIKKIGKKSIIWFILLNLLGAMFPVSISLMGQYPIATIEPNTSPTIFLEVPLDDIASATSMISPDPQALSELTDNSFGVSLRVLSSSNASLTYLFDWIGSLNQTTIPYEIISVSSRNSLVPDDTGLLGSTDLFQGVFAEFDNSLTLIEDYLSSSNIVNPPTTIFFDLTLSDTEWNLLMDKTRSVDILGFSGLVRSAFDSVNSSFLFEVTESLTEKGDAFGYDFGAIVESYILDDLQDSDTVSMKSTGVSVESLDLWSSIRISTSRTRYSEGMNSDVGEYLVHSYSRSLETMNTTWSMSIGEIGQSDETGFNYQTIDELVSAISICAGNGVDTISVGSLTSFNSTFGLSALSDFRNAIDAHTPVEVTYTFRIYAFRAVFIAIDSFDLIMF
ncbi:MAG: hypothetical protein ACTSV2_17805 [Candidatus Thorarchaeota archaeon]